MRASCEWFVLCDRIIHDSFTGQISLVGCLDEVFVPAFPALRAGFACAARYRWAGDPPVESKLIEHRIVRLSASDQPEVVLACHGQWNAGAHQLRFLAGFEVIRLKREEVLGFRLDHRLDDSDWIEGPTTLLYVRATAEPPTSVTSRVTDISLDKD